MTKPYRYWEKAKTLLVRDKKPFSLTTTEQSARLTEKLKTLNFQNCHLNYAYENKRILSNYVSLASDQKRRSVFERRELQTLLLKSVLNSKPIFFKPGLQPKSVDRAGLRFSTLGLITNYRRKIDRRKGTITRVRNRCVLTGHPSTVGKLGVSRIAFRNLAGLGKIPGLVKI